MQINFFSSAGSSAPTPPKQPPLQIPGYAPESDHVFALLVSMPPEFSLMPFLKRINLYQNKPKIKSFLQKIKIFRVLGTLFPDLRYTAPPHCRFLVPRLILDVCCSHFQILKSYKEKLLSLQWVKASFLRRPRSNDLSSTRTLVTLLCLRIRRFTTIIFAWWLRTSSKFSGQEFKEIRRNIWIIGNS